MRLRERERERGCLEEESEDEKKEEKKEGDDDEFVFGPIQSRELDEIQDVLFHGEFAFSMFL